MHACIYVNIYIYVQVMNQLLGLAAGGESVSVRSSVPGTPAPPTPTPAAGGERVGVQADMVVRGDEHLAFGLGWGGGGLGVVVPSEEMTGGGERRGRNQVTYTCAHTHIRARTHILTHPLTLQCSICSAASSNPL